MEIYSMSYCDSVNQRIRSWYKNWFHYAQNIVDEQMNGKDSKHVKQFWNTGTTQHYEHLKRNIPKNMISMMKQSNDSMHMQPEI